MSVYADFAATAAVRPPEVARAVSEYLGRIGATPGRGAYPAAVEAGRVALRCRMLLSRLLGLPGDPGRTVFMFNATHALNTALRGTLGRGDVCVRTVYDHNAVVRPLAALQRERGVRVRVLGGTTDGEIDLQQARTALQGARLLVLNAASNVLGCRLALEALVPLAREAGARVLLDSAQLAGHAPLDAGALGVDMLAFTGHKGLLGPQGTGGLWLAEGTEVEPLLRGGTGGDSRLEDMPRSYPDRLEAGTQNGPGIAGLAAGIEWLLGRGVAALHAELDRLREALGRGLEAVSGVRVLSSRAPGGAPVVTIAAESLAPSELAARLAVLGVACRAGLHCAPDAHRLLGTIEEGAVRFSLGWSSTREDVDAIVASVERALAGPVDIRAGTKRSSIQDA